MKMFMNIGFIILIVLGIVYFIYIIKTNFMNKDMVKCDEKVKEEKELFFPTIQVIEDNDSVPNEKNKIVDLDIKNTISRLYNDGARASIITNNLKNASELLNNNRVFFSAAKKGTDKMLEVKGRKNEVYGIQMKKDKLTNRELFHKQTKFRKENELIKSSGKSALANAGFNALSMVVGQYYMSEINDKLETISNNINEISNFQASEYQSKLLHIVSKMEEILGNQSEILSNEESRKNAYHDNKELETECVELLGQANVQISKELTGGELDYKKYENKVKKIQEWFLRQQVTQELLMKIGDLRYVLANGTETSRLSHNQYNNYLKQTSGINKRLGNWHNIYIKKFGIDIDKQRKKGNLFKIREYTIGVINEQWKYDKIQYDTIQQIISQICPKEFELFENNKHNEKIIIQRYKGEYYNLPVSYEIQK